MSRYMYSHIWSKIPNIVEFNNIGNFRPWCWALMLWHLQLIYQLNRFLALQALVERLGICIATFGLKFPILLNSTILGILDLGVGP